jgi:16S rRNA (cytidine1402-2'-O)-methyltransferase
LTSSRETPGILYLVATPIGNLSDISARAVKTLGEVNVIAAEDTRHTSILLRHLGVSKEMVSLHEHNEKRRAGALVKRMIAGESVALVSDAGTPLVSDPGFLLVTSARQAGIPVSPVPGPCALIAALSASGIAPWRFTFEGFLPPATGARRRTLSALAAEHRSMVFYESPVRVRETISQMIEVFGSGRQAAIGRELTKRYETIKTASLGELLAWLDEDEDHRRGEFVIVVSGFDKDTGQACRPEWVEAVLELRAFMPLKQACRIISRVTGASSQALYRAADEAGPN